MQPRAIETRYKGYRFRSRLEARWAVFFDALGLRWEYEPEGFELPGGVRYLPDFRLHVCGGVPLYVEVKPPGALSPADITKLSLFVDDLLAANSNAGLMAVRGDPMNADALMFGAFGGERKGSILNFNAYVQAWCGLTSKSFDAIKSAAEKARGARFEHGESGARA